MKPLLKRLARDWPLIMCVAAVTTGVWAAQDTKELWHLVALAAAVVTFLCCFFVVPADRRRAALEGEPTSLVRHWNLAASVVAAGASVWAFQEPKDNLHIVVFVVSFIALLYCFFGVPMDRKRTRQEKALIDAVIALANDDGIVDPDRVGKVLRLSTQGVLHALNLVLKHDLAKMEYVREYGAEMFKVLPSVMATRGEVMIDEEAGIITRTTPP